MALVALVGRAAAGVAAPACPVGTATDPPAVAAPGGGVTSPASEQADSARAHTNRAAQPARRINFNWVMLILSPRPPSSFGPWPGADRPPPPPAVVGRTKRKTGRRRAPCARNCRRPP